MFTRTDFRTRRVEGPAPWAWQQLVTHPAILATAASGRAISFLVEVGDEIVAGYGDGNANTGPTSLVGYNKYSAEPVTLLANCPTENFARAVMIDGYAYFPCTDSTLALNNGAFATNRTGSWTWVTLPNYAMIHVFDVAKINGLIHVCGSAYGDPQGKSSEAVVWRENANGAWTKVVGSGPLLQGLGTPRFYDFYRQDNGAVLVQTSQGIDTLRTFVTDGIGGPWQPVDRYSLGSPDDIPRRFPSEPAFIPPKWKVPFHNLTGYVEVNGWAWCGFNDGTVRRAPL